VHRYIDELHLLHAIRLALVATDAEGRVTFLNEAAEEMLGADLAQVSGRHVLDLTGAVAGKEAFDLAAVLGGGTWRGDLVLRTSRGDLVVAARATAVRTADDSVVGAVLTAEDMTEIRAVEADGAASEQRLRLAHEAAELGSWHWDMATGDVVWDEQLEAIYGMPRGSFGRTFEAWVATVHPDDRDEVLDVVQKAMATRSSYVLRNRITWPDGTERWIEAHGKVTTDAEDNPTGTIGCVRDVTDRILSQQRESAAAARALLLQDVTADLVSAWTEEEVERVLRASLPRIAEILPEGVELAMPAKATHVTAGEAFVVGDGVDLAPADRQLLDTLASQGALAAQRARLEARTTSIAEQLQASLAASPLPALDRFELAVHYEPGGDELEHVGGDWYDAVATPSGALALVVGDVMGRGVRAATTMIRVRAGIRGLLTVDPAPDAVLVAADELMTRDAPEQFVTAAAVLADPETGDLALCSAGHVPVLLVHPDGRTELLGDGTGLPLGLLTGIERSSVGSRLHPGSIVVLVTDGVVESRGGDLDEVLERLRRQAVALRGEPLTTLVAGIAALADTSLRDDVTVVAARLR
jgi:PAS domain S-box-containing protein